MVVDKNVVIPRWSNHVPASAACASNLAPCPAPGTKGVNGPGQAVWSAVKLPVYTAKYKSTWNVTSLYGTNTSRAKNVGSQPLAPDLTANCHLGSK